MRWSVLFFVILCSRFSHGDCTAAPNPLKALISSAKSCASTTQPWLNDPDVQAYSSSPKADTLVNYALRNKAATGMERSIWRCNPYVLKAVQAAGMPGWTGAAAYYASQVKDAGKNLGYKNLLEKYPQMRPEDAPKGAILVYSADPKPGGCKTPRGDGCGHVEIKTENGYDPTVRKPYFVSDYSDLSVNLIASDFESR
jgi:hypothetical protein